MATESGLVGEERRLERKEALRERRRSKGWERGRRRTRMRIKRMCLHGVVGSGQEQVGVWDRVTV